MTSTVDSNKSPVGKLISNSLPGWPLNGCQRKNCIEFTPAYFCTKCIAEHYAIKKRYDRKLEDYKEKDSQRIVNEFLAADKLVEKEMESRKRKVEVEEIVPETPPRRKQEMEVRAPYKGCNLKELIEQNQRLLDMLEAEYEKEDKSPDI